MIGILRRLRNTPVNNPDPVIIFLIFKSYYYRQMKNLVILSGAGMSAESGIRTFRETGGLWEEFDVTEVASPM